MIEEIVYTSAPRGLKPGSRGFCTVASTPGMAGPLATLLESLSGYRHLAEPGSSTEGQNPTVYNHFKLRVGGRSIAILSRVADAGHDYSGRTNKLAHHIALTAGRPITEAGPVATQQHEGFHETTWSGEPRLIEVDRVIPEISNEAAACNYWNQITGDAGWGGVVAGRVAEKPSGDVWIIYPAGLDMLRLLGESFALLPAAKRWEVTYTTFFTKLPPGVECRIRCVVDGTAEASQARKRYELNVIDLCGLLGEPPAGVWTEVARTGQRPQPPKQQPPKQKPPKQQPLELQLDHPTDPELAPVFGEDDQFELDSPELQLSPSPLPPLLSAGRPIPGPRSGRRWMVLTAVVVVLLLIVIGLGSAVLLGTKLARRNASADVEQSASSEETSDKNISDDEAEPGKPSLDDLEKRFKQLVKDLSGPEGEEDLTGPGSLKGKVAARRSEVDSLETAPPLLSITELTSKVQVAKVDLQREYDQYIQGSPKEEDFSWEKELAVLEDLISRAEKNIYRVPNPLQYEDDTSPLSAEEKELEQKKQDLKAQLKKIVDDCLSSVGEEENKWNQKLDALEGLKKEAGADGNLLKDKSQDLKELEEELKQAETDTTDRLEKLQKKVETLITVTDLDKIKDDNTRDLTKIDGMISNLEREIAELKNLKEEAGPIGALQEDLQDKLTKLETNSASSLQGQVQKYRGQLKDIIADRKVEIELTNLLTKVLENSQENSNKPLGLDEPDDQRGSNDQREPIDSRFEFVPKTAQLFLPRSKKQPLVMINHTLSTPTEILLCTIDTLTVEEGEELLRVEIAESELKGSPSIDLKNNDERYGNLLRHSVLKLDIKEGDTEPKERRIRFSKPRFAPAANLSNLPPQQGPQPPSRLNFSLEDSDVFPEASWSIRVTSLGELGELKDPKPRDLDEATNAEGIFLIVPINKYFDINVKIKMERTRDDWQVSLTIAGIVVKDVPELPPGVFSPPQPIGFQQNPQWPGLPPGLSEEKGKTWNQFWNDVRFSWGNLLRDYETKPLFDYEVYIPLEKKENAQLENEDGPSDEEPTIVPTEKNKDGESEELVIITSGPDGIDGGEQP